MRSPSRDPQKRSIKEEEVIKEHQNSQLSAPVRTTFTSLSILLSHILIIFNRFPVAVVDWAI